MLEMKSSCERCQRDLPPTSTEAFICSYECTFCSQCTTTDFGENCPNCGGNLERRPTRQATTSPD